MKKTKRFLSLIMFVIFFCITITTTASANSERVTLFENEKCGSNAYATLYDDGELVIFGSGTLGNNEFDNTDGIDDPWNYSPPWNYFYSSNKYVKNIRKIVISEDVTAIGEFSNIAGVFCDCVNLEEVVLPQNLEKIGAYAFYNCYRLKNIDIPETVTSIGEYAFFGCGYLEEITIPTGVDVIGKDAFGDCIRLSKIVIENPDCEIDWSKTTLPEKAILYGYVGSSLEEYANYWMRDFVEIGSEDEGTNNEKTHTHTYPDDWLVVYNTTCSQDGLSIKICNNCNAFEIQTTTSYGHMDNNDDNKCDECQVVVNIVADSNISDDFENKKNLLFFISDFFNEIFDFFRNLFMFQ